MAPIDVNVWHQWVRLHKAGQEVRVANRSIPMNRLVRSWRALGYRALPAVREQFLRTHVEPYTRSRVGLVRNLKTRDQLRKRCGSDVAYVERRVCILKKFRTKNKYQRSLVALQRTASCQCTPAAHQDYAAAHQDYACLMWPSGLSAELSHGGWRKTKC